MRVWAGWAVAMVATLLVAGCTTLDDLDGCVLRGTRLTWSETDLWPRMPVTAGDHGGWVVQETLDGERFPIDHARTPGWEADDGLWLKSVWWKSPHAAQDPVRHPWQQPDRTPGWIELVSVGYSRGNGTSVRQYEAGLMGPAGLDADQVTAAFEAFLAEVAPGSTDDPSGGGEGTAPQYRLFDLQGPLDLEGVYARYARPALPTGDLSEDLPLSDQSTPWRSSWLRVPGWIFEFMEAEASAWNPEAVAGLQVHARGETILFAEEQRVGEREMRRLAGDAYTALGLGKPSFDDAAYEVDRVCQAP